MYKIDEGVNEKEVIGKYTVKQLEEIFKEYVGDKDALDEESLQLLIKEKLDQYIPKKQVTTLIRSIDIDGNGEIEFNLKQYISILLTIFVQKKVGYHY